MKTIAFVLLAGLLGAGCIPGGVGPGASFAESSRSQPGSFDGAASSPTDPGASFDDSSSSQTDVGASVDDSQSSGPQVVIPATGGAPELATPVGGDMYIPVTGGPPIVGIGT